MQLAGSRVLLLGAGGAARAAALALATKLGQSCAFSAPSGACRALARAAGAQSWRAELRREYFDAIVNCTPVACIRTVVRHSKARNLNCRLVMDMVYRPRTTELLRIARRRASRPFPGLKCFSHRDSRQYEIWTVSVHQKLPRAAR